LCRRRELAVRVDLGPDQAHHDPYEHQPGDHLQGGQTRVQLSKKILDKSIGNLKSAERNREPARPARREPSAREKQKEQHDKDGSHDIHAQDGPQPGWLGGDQGLGIRGID
jgi:hypothetical protein